MTRAALSKIPAMTDFRAKGTIIGLTGLTAVFGMGTGGTPSVWSPEIPEAGDQTRRGHFGVFGHGWGGQNTAACVWTTNLPQMDRYETIIRYAGSGYSEPP